MGTLTQSPETRDNCPLQIGKTKGISRPLLLWGLNQWIGRSVKGLPSSTIAVSRSRGVAPPDSIHARFPASAFRSFLRQLCLPYRGYAFVPVSFEFFLFRAIKCSL
jgi:hypothetical protein